jgi:hypothetical protein
MNKYLLVLTSALFIVSCSSKFTPPAPTEADVLRAAASFPNITLSELNEGKMHFEVNCSKCHGLKNPTSRSEEQWNSIVPKMTAKANKKAGKEVITPAMQQSILQYVVAMSSLKKKA